jgi:EAL domain-containing protein (putative c-di-GMP-specific phosphodiesterase class I)/CheY-like chemotaxis protein
MSLPAVPVATASIGSCDRGRLTREWQYVGPQVLSDAPATSLSAADEASHEAATPGSEARVPLCFVIDADDSVRRFLSLILHGAGLNTEEFSAGETLAAALAKRAPHIVFLDIALEFGEAVKCLLELANCNYRGQVQLVSGRGSAVLAHVKSIGEQQHLQMLPVLKKPIEPQAILNALQELKLGHAPPTAGRIGLDQALNNGWIEFWYQPMIDLRKKQLVAAESFARARHPQHGIMLPDAFMPGATETTLVKLAEYSLVSALKAGLNFAKLGVNLQLAVNMSAAALGKVRFPEILQTYRPQFDRWPGLIVDVAEEQLVSDLARVSEIARELKQLGVSLAIDNCGRRYTSLANLKELPFTGIKLDRAFVADCATSKVNAPLCKTVIDLAHSFGSVAVAIGIEKASDALALLRMGCDYGQGFLLGQPMPEELFGSLLRQRAAGQTRQAFEPSTEPAEASL